MEQLDIFKAMGVMCTPTQRGSDRNYLVEMLQYMQRAIDKADNSKHYDKLIKSWNEDNNSEKEKQQ